ncbi:hypothetical protein NESM_000811800 [Novymonas esmeraldas]|uniref:Ribosomal protein L30 ferredoxin-like fold domain-containing protein n=1 Tax=Novymonas esmeraldas TaxID=1808958 RepID=A0AAW0EW23_9TRYP
MLRLLRCRAVTATSAAEVAAAAHRPRRALHTTHSVLATTTTTTTSTHQLHQQQQQQQQPSTTAIAAGPYRRVGNIFIVSCIDHPFKFSWEVNRVLRELRLEFMGQSTIMPDIPATRKRLWRVRHIVRVDQLDLDEARALVGVPEHISFRDLASQITPTFGRGRAVANPGLRSKMNFMQLRRMRLRDVLHRDALERRLLEEKRNAKQQQQS